MAKKSFFNSSVEGIIKSYDQPKTGESANGAPAAEFLSGQASAPVVLPNKGVTVYFRLFCRCAVKF